MGKRFVTVFVLVFVGLFCLVLVGVVFAESSNWVEVTRYEGSIFPGIEEFDSEGFVADHEEWRIRWSYDAVGSPLESFLMIAKGSDMIVISSGYVDRSSIKILHGIQKDFSLYITCINLNRYTIIIEKDVNSIPEFQPWMAAPIILSITLATIIAKRKIDKKN